MTGDIRSFVQRCPMCQMEKSDHTLSKGKLQSIQISETKWSEISIDFVTNLHKSSRNRDSILIVIDKATRIVYMEPWGRPKISGRDLKGSFIEPRFSDPKVSLITVSF